MPNVSHHLPAEWAPQSAVQLAWPHAHTDWADILPEVQECYLDMAHAIAGRESLIVVTPHAAEVEKQLQSRLTAAQMLRVRIVEMPTNDTWVRDYGFLTLQDDKGDSRLLDFRFNGWGQKFAANLDNLVCRRMAQEALQLGMKGSYVGCQDFVLEGGSIESDGRGTLLTTTACLMAPNRNEPLTQAQIEDRLLRELGAQRILWLQHGHLAGDDTDSHIDTLTRLCPDDTLAYVQCSDPADEHYADLSAMEAQLRTFRTLQGLPYRLVPLPMAEAEFDAEGNRLPATYANFLIMNGAVLMPAYGHAELDAQAERQLQIAFPHHEIVPINCRVLIEQHGSLHCCTMQFPEGVF